MPTQSSGIYGGRDPLDIPAYTFTEAARYLRLPLATVRVWSLGQRYETAAGGKKSQPLIEIADVSALSFRNVIELHVLSSIRRKHRVKMKAVRSALQFLKRQLNIQHPLAAQEMVTDGKDLFIERYGKLVNISSGGQLEMKHVVDAYLARIERDARGLPIRLFPFTRTQLEGAPKSIAMSPTVQFGRPCIAGTGIATSVIAERYHAGESHEKLAEDYEQEIIAIEEAIRIETQAA